MVCNNCGSYNDDSAKFCIGCGAALNEQQQEAPSAEPVNTAFNGGYSGPTYTAQPVAPEQPATVPGKGLGIASMVCGIVSFFCFGIILGILAIAFGATAKSKGYKGGMATAGIVCGIVGLALFVLSFILGWNAAFYSLF